MDLIWYPSLTLAEAEKSIIKKAMRHFRNNKTQTARSLGIAIRTLDYKWADILQEEENAAKGPQTSAHSKVS